MANVEDDLPDIPMVGDEHAPHELPEVQAIGQHGHGAPIPLENAVQPGPAVAEQAPIQIGEMQRLFQSRYPKTDILLRPKLIHPEYTQGQRNFAVDLLERGLSYRQAASHISPTCSAATVQRWHKDHKLAYKLAFRKCKQLLPTPTKKSR